MYRHIEKGRKQWDFTAVSAVAGVFIIILLEYYGFFCVFAPHLFAISPLLGIFLYVEVHLFVFIMVWSYYKVITTGPGYLSAGINENFSNVEEIKEKQKLLLRYKYVRNSDNPGQGVEIAATNENTNTSQGPEDLENNPEHMRIKKIASNPVLQLQEIGYCFKCKRVKIPRAHHCKQCGKCVLRMDHHCPWTGNCIGLYNHKFFLLFLVYAFLTIFQIFIWQCCFVAFGSLEYNKGLTADTTIILQVSLVASGALSMAIGCLMGYQLYITANNLTTVEHHIPGIVAKNPFDKGSKRNFEEVLGEDRSTWMWPTEPRLQSEEDLFMQY